MHPVLDAHTVYVPNRCELDRAVKGTYVPHHEGSVPLEGLRWNLKKAPARLSVVRFLPHFGSPRLASHAERTPHHM